MPKIAGVDVLVKVVTATDSTGVKTWSTIGGQSGATLNRSTNLIEITAKDSNKWAESIAGVKNWSVECDGFLVTDDVALKHLETLWINGGTVELEIAVGGKKYSGKALIEDFPQEFPTDDAVSFSLSLTGTGALTIV